MVINIYIYILLIVLILVCYYIYLKTIDGVENFQELKVPNYKLKPNGFPSNNAFQLHSRSNNNVIHLSTNNNNFFLKPIDTSFSKYNYLFAFYDKYLYSITDGVFIDVLQPMDASIPDKFVLTNNIPTNSNVIWRFVDGNLTFTFKNQSVDELSQKYLPKTWTQPKVYYIHFDVSNQNMYVDNNKINNELFLNVLKKNVNDDNLLLEKIVFNKINQKFSWNISKIPVEKRRQLAIEYDIVFPNKFKNQIAINKTSGENAMFEFFSSVNCIFYIQIYYLKDKPLTIQKTSSSSQTTQLQQQQQQQITSDTKSSQSFNIEYHKQYPQLVRQISKNVASKFGIYDPKTKLYYRCNDVIQKIKKPSFSIQYAQVPVPKYIQPSVSINRQQRLPNFNETSDIKKELKQIRSKIEKPREKNNYEKLSKTFDKKIMSIEQKILQKMNKLKEIKQQPIIIKLDDKREQKQKEIDKKIESKNVSKKTIETKKPIQSKKPTTQQTNTKSKSNNSLNYIF